MIINLRALLSYGHNMYWIDLCASRAFWLYNAKTLIFIHHNTSS